MFKTVHILGLQFPILTYDTTLDLFATWIDEKTPHQVCIVNVHTITTGLWDKELNAVNHRSLLTMDGMPLVWYANLVRNANINNRVSGPDLMQKCLAAGCSKGWKHFFLGSRPETLQDLVNLTTAQYPDVKIVGWHSPPYRSLSAAEDQQLVDLINAAKPDFLWVALGAPKQEKWIAAHLPKLHAPIQIGVGAAFSYHSGHIARAPAWMQHRGLEWLYRLFQERRLLGRYLLSNQIFLLLFLRDLLLAKVFHPIKSWLGSKCPMPQVSKDHNSSSQEKTEKSNL
ncbi:WecB/TagA/CpsF family glycosyltransferase [Methylomonas paludis]|uniref:WecB/TagA/CpsF family glycosyltransferase n=1 Tax=Methylomonas paludis TaxID=1173101 RepID=A0A975MNY9_9GAMM|nr:WecB/TagA/CpsF family glycosyltransferase [Methylomonas paludis]QWF71114.1 WecB/TagA/CpsF family glycosyltransferase [Methylomonas paludis]